MRPFFLLIICALSLKAQPLSINDVAFAQSTSRLRNGLVGCWRFEESSGNRYDFSKNGFFLNSSNSVASTTGRVGNCASFTAASSQFLVTASSSTALAPATMTITAWVNLASKGGNRIIAMHPSSDGSTWDYYLFFRNASDNFAFSLAGGTALQATTFGSPSLNTWYFVAAKIDPVAGRSYISVNNGAFDSAVAAMTPNNYKLYIGGQTVAGAYMDGKIDEMHIWNRLLTASELTQLYNAGLGTHFPWMHK